MASRALFVALSLVLIPVVVGAASFSNPLASKFIVDMLRGFVLAVIYVGTPILAVFIVWTGFLFVAALGNPEGLSKAKKMAVRVAGFGTLLLGLWAIIRIVGNTLSGVSSAALLIVLAGFLLYVFYYRKG